MPTADLAPLGSQQPSQHPRAGKRELQMQPVETSHDLQVGRRHRPWQVVDTATADAKHLRLLCDRQIVLTVDHRFALSNPALVSAPSKKLADLGMKRLHVDGRLCCSVAAPCTEHIGSPAFELPLPRCDLVGVDIELLRKLSQCSIAFDGGKRHFRFENRCMVPARSSGHGLSCFAVAQRACCQAETPPIVLYRFPGPALGGALRALRYDAPGLGW